MPIFAHLPTRKTGLWQAFLWVGWKRMQSRLNKPDVFSYYALLSGGIYTPDELKDKTKPKLIFISCGSRERPDGVKNAVTTLNGAGYNAVSYVSENTAHEFLTWRRSLHELAPLLFKD